MSTDWTHRIRLDNTTESTKATTLGKYAPDKRWHTRPKDDQDALLNNEVWHGTGKGSPPAPLDWLRIQYQESPDQINITTVATKQATVERSPGASPRLEMRVGGRVLVLAIFDQQLGWHDDPNVNIDPLIKSTLDPMVPQAGWPDTVQFVVVLPS
jgi:hypothetical protein